MSTLNERIRADVFQSWKLALHALQEIRIIDRRYHVLTAAEKIDLAACLSRYSKVSEEHDRIVVANGSLEQALALGRAGGNDYL